MAQSNILESKGEHTYSSDISGVPPGSLALGLNININRINIMEPRRGFNLLAYGLPSGSDRAKKVFFWNDAVFCHYGSTFSYYDSSSGFLNRGSLSAPSNATSVRSVSSSNKNFYCTSSTGLLKTDAISKTDAIATSLYAAGVPRALTIDLSVAGAGTAIENNKSVTYQFLIARQDANNNTQFGGVSGRFTLSNTAGSTQNVTAVCNLPTGLGSGYFVQLYKTRSQTSAAATGEELQLCYETPIAAAATSVTITDIIPDELVLGAYLYTSPSQQGISGNNLQPPLARDIAEFKGCMFFADIESKQSLSFTLVSVSGTGLVATDTVVISDGTTTETFTADAAYSSFKFVLYTASGSPAVNIDTTIKSFIKCVNEFSTKWYAFSLSAGATDLPGKVQLQSRTLGATAFTVVCSARPAAWQPQLTSPATVNNTSKSDQYRNGIAWSKVNQPEAVPAKYVTFVGASDDPILRIKPLRDGLFIFKESGGAYVLRGETETAFAVSILDITAKLVAPDSLEAVNNSIYGLFEAGICEVSDTGVSIISIPIKDQLLPLYGAMITAVKAYSFGISNDTEGKYILSVPETSSDTTTFKQIIYDVFGNTFCRWDLNLTCGGVNPTDSKVYIGDALSNYVKLERKSFDYTDFADYGSTVTISLASGTTLTVSGTSNFTAGDILYQGTDAIAYISSVDVNAGTVVVDSTQTWIYTANATTHLKAINCKIQWNPDYGGNPGAIKQYYEVQLLQMRGFQKSATFYFSTDINPGEASISITSASGNGAFGVFDFGTEVFGGSDSKSPVRLGVPRGHARCGQLSVRFEHRIAYSDYQINGLSLSFNNTSTRVTR